MQVGLLPRYYHREFTHDIGEDIKTNSWISQSRRIALVLLPPLTALAYQNHRLFVTRSLGLTRVVMAIYPLVKGSEMASHKLNALISAATVVCTLYSYRLSMIMMTSHDLALELWQLFREANNPVEKLENILRIVNSLLYLSLYFYGGFWLQTAALGLQMVANLNLSLSRFHEDHFLEGFGYVLNAMMFSWYSVQVSGNLFHAIDLTYEQRGESWKLIGTLY